MRHVLPAAMRVQLLGALAASWCPAEDLWNKILQNVPCPVEPASLQRYGTDTLGKLPVYFIFSMKSSC